MTVAGIQIEIERKKIKHTHLAVYPPDARVHVSAPEELDERDIRSYVAAKLVWIREQRRAILAQSRQTRREYVSGESIYALGKRYRLWVVETSPHAAKRRTTHAAKGGAPHTAKGGTPLAAKGGAPHAAKGGTQLAVKGGTEAPAEEISACGTRLTLRVRAGASQSRRGRIVEAWQRALLEECVKGKMDTWCKRLGREQPLMEIRKMRTKWASCLRSKDKIAFNAALARVPPRCIEYVVVHELTHFEVANHSAAFVKLMDERLHRWRALRDELNGFIGMPMEDRP